MIATTDYERMRETVALVDRSARGKLRLTGPDAAEFLQGQVTNDVEGLAPGGGCYAALLTHKGKLRVDMRILRGADWIWIDCEAAALPALQKTIRMYSIGRDVGLADVTGEYAIASLIGPDARSRLDAAPPPREYSFVEGDHGIYVATDLGVDVICPTGELDVVREQLGVDDAPEEAAECIRVESGRPRLGLDMSDDTIPQEAGLNARAVSFTKGCYVGQETVARLHYKGKPNRHLRGLRLSGERAATGDEVTFDGRHVGTLGTVTVSPALGPIALAILRREVGPGDTVSIGADGTTAEVVELPF